MHKNEKVDKQQLIKFGNTGFWFFLVIGSLLFLKFRLSTRTEVVFGLSLFFLICPRVAPPVMLVVFKIMTAVGGVVGWLNRTILLALVFFAMFTPVSLVMKLIGRDPMERRMNKSGATYWKKRGAPPKANPAQYENRF